MESDLKPRLHAEVSLGANGSILIPAEIRKETGFAPGDTLLTEVEGGVLRVAGFDARLARIQDELVQLAGPDRILSEELIAERREEARREEEKIERDEAARRGRNSG
jgi:bifunctional DNA-binding transcriptional regulator/antitoxin component of YhaV-PrlF toxin-antitoxin module